MQPAANFPASDIKVEQTPQAKFLEAVANKGDKANAQDLSALFKNNVPNSKQDVRNYAALSAYNVKDQILRQNSTQGLEKQIKGSLIALKIAMENTPIYKFEEKANIAKQIAELESLQKSSPGKILQSKLLKTISENDKALLEKLKDPQIVKDLDNILEVYGTKRSISSDKLKLFLRLKDSNPEAFSACLQKIVDARKSNMATIYSNQFMNLDSDVNREHANAVSQLRSFTAFTYDPSDVSDESKKNLVKTQKDTVSAFINELSDRSAYSVSQLNQETIYFAVDPHPKEGDVGIRTKQQMDEANALLDKTLSTLREAPQNERLKKDIESLEKGRNYYYNPRANRYEKAEWKIDEEAKKQGKENVWLRTIGFKSVEGDIKEAPVKLDLSSFKDVDQKTLFKFLQQADFTHGWIDKFQNAGNPKQLTDGERKLLLAADGRHENINNALYNSLNNIKNKDGSELTDRQKNELLGIAANFTREMYIDYYKKLFTLGN